jgi:hypothetical protein
MTRPRLALLILAFLLLPSPALAVTPTPTPVPYRFRASYVPLDPALTAEVLSDGFVVVSDVRALEPLCAPSPAPGTACVTFLDSLLPGGSRRFEMRAIDDLGIRSALSNAIVVTVASPTPPPSLTPTPSRTPTLTAPPSSTPSKTGSPTATPTPTLTASRTATPSPTPTRTPPAMPIVLRVDVVLSDGTIVSTFPSAQPTP